MARGATLAALRDDRTVRAVVALAALALAARLALLGARVAHQDEARVGYWTLRYAVSGKWEYRPIVHGPFIPVVNRHLFGLLGASDFVARLPMAVLGGIAPLGALLFRRRLRGAETVAFAALLAANPVLLYYSRFMRQDLPLAVFALFALGLAVRAIDAPDLRRRRRYVVLSALALGLAFTTKENAVLYPVAWAGAAALVADVRLTRYDAAGEGSALSYLRSRLRGVGVGRAAAAVGVLAANPASVWLLGVPGDSAGVPTVAAFLVLVAVGLVGAVAAVRSPNPLHYLGAVPLAALALVGIAGAVFPGVGGPVGYVYDRFLVYYAVSWLLGAALLADAAVVSRPWLHGPRRPTGGSPPGDRDDRGTDPSGPPDGAGADGSAGSDGEPTGSTDGGVAGEWATFLPPALAAFAVFFAVVILFYAPRGGGYPATPGDTGGWGLWSALLALDPVGIAAVVWEATVGTWTEFVGSWVGGGHQDHAYLPFFGDFAKTMGAGALTVCVGAVAGTLADRYGDGGPRDLVQFSAYWGVASVLGYPLVTDIPAPWSTVHAVVPLAIPAAVALALVYRGGAGALAADDRRGVAVAAAIGLLVVGQVGYAAATGVYLSPQSPDNELVQYAQSSSTDLRPVLADAKSVARGNEGVDVLYYGDEFHGDDESDNDQPYAGSGWFGRLPLAWYTESWAFEWRGSPATVTVDSTASSDAVGRSSAPVVVALGDRTDDGVVCEAPRIEEHLSGYHEYCGQRYLYDSGSVSTVLVYVDADRIDDPAGAYRGVVGADDDPGSGNRSAAGA